MQHKLFIAEVQVTKKPEGNKVYRPVKTKILVQTDAQWKVQLAVEKELNDWIVTQDAYIKSIKITHIVYNGFVTA